MERKAYYVDAPMYRINGCEFALTNTGTYRYADDRFFVNEENETLSPSLIRVRRSWKNLTDAKVAFQPIFQATTNFVADHYVIPCVSYNGNEWGRGNEPKGLTKGGVPFIFSYQRTGIPSCTLSENGEIAFCLFASDADPSSLVSSCSLRKGDDGTFSHRILYPVIEEPQTYCARDAYGDAFQSYIELLPGEVFSASVYLWDDKPRWKNFGMAGIENIMLGLSVRREESSLAPERVWELGIAYAKRLVLRIHERRLLCIGLLPDGDGGFSERLHYEIGWCGQNALYARMLLLEYRRSGDEDSLALGLEILDTWTKNAPRAGGLMYVHYENQWKEGADLSDTCNLSYAAAELIRAHKLLKTLGIERPLYYETARNICRFFIEKFDETHGFGKSWHVGTGAPGDMDGTIGAYMIIALAEYHRMSGDAEALATAMRAMELYASRDLDQFVCTAGALDTSCVDKETSGALIAGGIMLYEETGDGKYLVIAEKAAYYFYSWAFHYDAIYEPRSDFSVYGYRTWGATSVSAQHHHLDAWGGFLVSWFIRLSELTGDPRWRVRARAMWSNVIQCIAVEDGQLIRGRSRPLGSQNEAFFHCRWGGGEQDAEAGGLNDWLVAWPGAFRLYTLASIEDWSALT